MERKPKSDSYIQPMPKEQFRAGKIDGSLRNRIECEIEAQQYLLENAKKLELTKPEIIQTRKALEGYNSKLSELKEKGERP